MKKKAVFLFACMIAAGVMGESFYQSYVREGTNNIAITNVGVNRVFVSGITCKYAEPVTNSVTVSRIHGSTTNTLYTVNLSSNQTFMIPKVDLAGIWLGYGDILHLTTTHAVSNTTIVDTEESR